MYSVPATNLATKYEMQNYPRRKSARLLRTRRTYLGAVLPGSHVIADNGYKYYGTYG